MIYLLFIFLFSSLFLIIAHAHKQSHIVAKVNIKTSLEKCFENFTEHNNLPKWLKGYKIDENNKQKIFLEINSISQSVTILNFQINENKEVYLKIKTKYFTGESWFTFYVRNSTETLVVNFNIWNVHNSFYRFLFYIFKNKIKINLTNNLEEFKNIVESSK